MSLRDTARVVQGAPVSDCAYSSIETRMVELGAPPDCSLRDVLALNNRDRMDASVRKGQLRVTRSGGFTAPRPCPGARTNLRLIADDFAGACMSGNTIRR